MTTYRIAIHVLIFIVVIILTTAVAVWLNLGPVATSASRSQHSGTDSGGAVAKLLLVPVHEGVGHEWSAYRLQGLERSVQVFLAHDAQPKPVVFLLQGSGCAPLFTVESDGTYHTTSLFQDVVTREASRVHFAMVEKQGVVPLRFTTGMTHGNKLESFNRATSDCSAEYMANVTKGVRVEDVLAAMKAVSEKPWALELILVGHSEGTHVVTGVLKRQPAVEIAAAGLFASASPIPFWGGYVHSNAGSREAFQTRFDRIRMLQNAPDDFMYEGLPARRWKTFWLESTPLDDVRESDVPLFVTQGTRDGSILVPDLFVMEAIRQKPTRPLKYVVLEEGGHAFEMPDGRSRVPELFNSLINWALDQNKATGTAVLK